MFNKSEILARLQKGDSMDEIAKEMTDVLNAANAQYQEEANAEKIEAARVMEAKRAAVDLMLDGLCDYLVAAEEETLLEELKDIDTDEMIETLDSIVAFAKSLEALKGLEFPLVKKSCNNESCECMNPKHKAFIIPKDISTMINKAFNSSYGIGHDK